MDAIAIRNGLRNNHSDDLDRRRKIICLSAIGIVDFSIISLYQTGVIKSLPDLPFPIFDSDKVNTSKSAYRFGVPDGTLGATGYGLTMALASAGGDENASRKPIFDVLLGGVIAGNAAGGLFYLYDMAFKQKKICLYCVTGAAINIASAIIIVPTVLKSLKKMFGR